MKKISILLAAFMLTIAAGAQTLNVVTGDIIWQFPASQTGEMDYSSGTTLTIMDKTFTISDITQIYIDDAEVTDNAVGVAYNGSSAAVTVSGNIAQYIDATVSGAHVTLTQNSSFSGNDAGEIEYTLSGSSTDGDFYMEGSYKCTVVFNGLTLTNPSGAAVNIQDGKRIDVKIQGGTENTLTDGSNGDQKGCLVVKGHAEFKGKGTLNITGNTKHAIKTGEYMTVKNCTINVLSAVKDGININEYFIMESGEITVTSVGDEGIQCDIDGDSSTGETTDHEDEDSGNIYIEGGTITVYAMSSEGIESKGAMTITDGIVSATAKDDAINSASHMTISGGYVMGYSTGNDGIDANGNMYIKGGVVYAIGTREPEVALDANTEGGYKLYIEGGTIITVGPLESGSSLTQSCYQASSWSSNTWYALYDGDDLALCVKTPSSGGTGMVVSTAGTPTLKSGVTVSGGTEYFTSNGTVMGYVGASVSGGSSVSLSTYSSGGGNQPGGGGNNPGGGGPGGGGGW